MFISPKLGVPEMNRRLMQTKWLHVHHNLPAKSIQIFYMYQFPKAESKVGSDQGNDFIFRIVPDVQ
jgi:hypothetical protein